jgi:predicted anti-sigma-YlaC factor YlaD
MVSCEDVLKHLSDFIDDEIEPGLGAAIKTHLDMCRRCSILYETMRKVLIIAVDEQTFEIPAGYSERLHAFIDQHL